MPIIQPVSSTLSFDPRSSGPPQHTMELPQSHVPISAPALGVFTQPSFPQSGNIQPQTQVQMQQPNFTKFSQQPNSPSQSCQEFPNMAPQQIQQVQQSSQNMPPEKFQMMTPQSPPMNQYQESPPSYQVSQQQSLQNTSFTNTAPSGPFGSKHSSSTSQPSFQDAHQSGKARRFFGDTLFGRVARSSVSTVTSFAKMPLSLSPWGDNNPVTLPNVRYRDAVLFTTFTFVGGPLVESASDSITSTFGADSFVAEIMNSGTGALATDTILKYSVFKIVEQAIDRCILEHMLPEEEKMLQTTEVKSLQVGIKHKLMGVDADLRFVGIQTARDNQAIEKGWFCPYLFASARTPSIPRANDFAIAQFFGPFLGGDYLLAHKLLSETTCNLAMCEANPTVDIGTNRMLILFTGISPYRANMWSTSRRPGCGTLVFQLLNGCPALVIPVTPNAPIVAWSPWTLSQMRAFQASNPPTPSHSPYLATPAPPLPPLNSTGYTPELQHEQVCEYLDTIISLQHVSPAMREKYESVLARSVSLVINGALATHRCGNNAGLGKVDPARAGIVMFRY